MSDLDEYLRQIEEKLKQRNNMPYYNNYLQNNNINRNNINFQNEARNYIRKEMYPYNNNYNNTRIEMQNGLNKIHQEIENLKYNGYNIEKINEDINNINSKFFKIEVDTANLEKNIKNNDDLQKNGLIEEEKYNENVINRYKEIEENYNEISKDIDIIKEEQNKVNQELMKSVNNAHNYDEEVTKFENKLNKFLDEQNIKFNNTLSEIYNNYTANSSNNAQDINLIKANINYSQEMLNNINVLIIK